MGSHGEQKRMLKVSFLNFLNGLASSLKLSKLCLLTDSSRSAVVYSIVNSSIAFKSLVMSRMCPIMLIPRGDLQHSLRRIIGNSRFSRTRS